MGGTAIWVMLVYLAVVTIVGIALARRATTATQWTVGGGGMGITMIAVGIAGTRIGGAGTYGVSGDVISGGVWNLWWYGISTFLAMALVGTMFAIPYRRLKLQTVGEIFTIRFGKRRAQVLTSLCVQTEYLIVNIIEAYVIGAILVGLLGIDMSLGVAIASVVLVSYITLGGLWGAAVTNLIHCAVIIGGLALVGVMGIDRAGGWDAVQEQVNAHLDAAGKDRGHWWGFFGAGLIPVFAMVFSSVIHTPAASVYTNFSTAAKSEKILLPGFLLAGLLGATMPILAGLVGILTLARFGTGAGLRGYSNITSLATEISPLVGGLALAAVLAAVVSSGGPILLSSATMFVRDWLPFSRTYTADQKLKAYRITTVVYAIVAAIIAYGVSKTDISILDLLLFGFAMVVPPAIAVGYLLYSRGTTEAGAYWGIAAGYGAGLVWFGLIKVAEWTSFEALEGASAARRLFHYLFVHTGEGIDPSYATTIVPLIAVPLISTLTARETDREQHFYGVVRGETQMADEA